MADDQPRISLNVRVDRDKYAALELQRKTGFGVAQTERNRSDVYNENLGYGIQVQLLKQEIGDRDFERVWKILHNINWRKINLEQLGKYVSKE